MTSTTMLESFDAQMLDYPPDNDISMYPSSTPAHGENPSWLAMEANMDDNNTVTVDTTSNHSEPVEVDMDANDEEITEYEMADGFDEELPDVEVYDIEHANVASPISEHVLEETATQQSTYGEDSAFSSTSPVVEYEHPADSLQTSEVQAGPSPVALSPAPGYFSNITNALSSDDASLPAVVETSLAEVLSTSSEIVHEAPEPAVEGESSSHTALPGPLVPTLSHDSSHTASSDSSDHPAAPPAPNETDETTEATAIEVHEPNILVHALLTTEHASEDAHDDNHDNAKEIRQQILEVYNADHQQEAEYGTGDGEGPFVEENEYTSSGDPHEISEGVYIDPPPAVLLSLPPSSSSEQHEFTLFNQPVQSSTPASPNAEASNQEHADDLSILLHERPTLYYEPLQTVFDALRDEILYRTPEFMDAELVFDAYDLHLTISEDNIHAQEVSLHDLNILHDGCQLLGPLRLRLHASHPRFIVRYTELRDEITRLHLANEEAEYGNVTVTEDSPSLATQQGVDSIQETDLGTNVEENQVNLSENKQEEQATEATTEEHVSVHDGTREHPIEVGGDEQPPEYTDNFSEHEARGEAVAGTDVPEAVDQPSEALEGEYDEEVTETGESHFLEGAVTGNDDEDDIHSQHPVDDVDQEDHTEHEQDPHDSLVEPSHLAREEQIELSVDETSYDVEEPDAEENANADGSVIAEDHHQPEKLKSPIPATPKKDSLPSTAIDLQSQEPSDLDENGQLDEDGLFDYEDPELDPQPFHDSQPSLKSQRSTDTLISRTSKRSFDQVEFDEDGEISVLESPGSKRARVV
ncbi:hypothetical protein C8Q75DRAFT_21057 [Abortiporus biennis]|nr:hypothetical protein C8Q75DRAFT_21057 [Abortiporus biennis]